MKSRSSFWRIICCFALLLSLATTESFAGKCPRCGGRGRIQTEYKVSGYGTNVRYKDCNICGKRIMVGESHWDPCPACNGGRSSSGSVGSSRSGGGSSGGAAADEILTRLSPAEAVRYQELAKKLYQGNPVPIRCEACNGTGDCTYCHGYHNLDIEATAAQRCTVCGGTGYCIRCNGKGNLGMKYELSEQERQSILAQLRELTHKAQQNWDGAGGVSMSNSSAGTGETAQSGGSSKVSPSAIDRMKLGKSDGGLGTALVLFGVVFCVGLLVICLLLFLLFKKR